MLLGKVVGTLVSSRKDEKLQGLKFLVLKQIDIECKETGAYRIAVDSVGAGMDEVVLYATGSAARQTAVTNARPVDAVIMAIVDQWDIGGVYRYQKYPEPKPEPVTETPKAS
jgi:microcompartment protein CcmK/EutM